jgi:regulator of sirC expression with transglutaminase-like and TPR domain
VSFLTFVLRLDSGNCIGYSTLYLALAERLGLPLRGVRAPEHVFVRWDDGRARRNIELTEDGREAADAEYARRPGSLSIAKESIGRGTFLASLTKKQVLAGILANLAALAVQDEAFEYALEEAGRSLTLDPRNAEALVNRAGARHQVDLDADAEALRDLDQALALHPASTGAMLLKSRILREAGRVDDALEAAARAVAIEPANPVLHAEKARCLSLLGRHEEAEAVLETASPPDDGNVEEAQVEVAVRRNPEAAARAAGKPDDPGARLVAARALIEPARGRAPDPAAALKVLGTDDELAALRGPRTVPWGPGGKTITVLESPRPIDRLRRHRHVLRGRALLLQGNAKAAREELALAEGLGPVDREIRKLRRALSGRAP